MILRSVSPAENISAISVYHISNLYVNTYTHVRNYFYYFLEVIIMSVKDAVVLRFQNICKERNMKINALAYSAGVTPSTAYSMMDKRYRDVSIVTIKKFCDGLDMTLGEFFSSPEFDQLEQEIK